MSKSTDIEGSFGQTARGTALLSLAQAFLMATGFLLHFILARSLGAQDYGRLAVVLSLLTWAEILASRIFPQASAHFMAARPEAARSTFATALRWQAGLVGASCMLMFVSAPQTAVLLGDRGLESGIRIAAISLPFSGMFHLYHHRSGGLRFYGTQSLLISLYSATKIVATCTLVLWTGSWVLALAGNIAASAAGALASWLARRPLDGREAGTGPRPMVRYGAAALMLAAIVIVFQSAGIWRVARTATDPAQLGLYAAALTISNIPVLAAGGLMISLVSSVARAVGTGRENLVPNYTQRSMRFVLVSTLPVLVAVWTSPSACLRMIYPAEFEGASAALALLVPAMIGLTLSQICWQVLQAAGQAWLVMGLCFLTGVLDLLALCIAPHADPITGAAVATLAAAGVGTAITVLSVWRRYGAPISTASLLRLAIAASAGVATGRFAGGGLVGLIAACAGYAAVLLSSGELGPEIALLRDRWPRQKNLQIETCERMP